MWLGCLDTADEKNRLWPRSSLPQKKVIALGLSNQWWSSTTERAWRSCCWDITCISIAGVAHIIQLGVCTYTIAEECFRDKWDLFPLSFLTLSPKSANQKANTCFSANTEWNIVILVGSDSRCFRNLTLTILKPGTVAKRHILRLLCPEGNWFRQNSGTRGVTATGWGRSR